MIQDASVNYKSYIDAGLIVFPLHPINEITNECACDRVKCTDAGKHPKAGNWQHTQAYDADQLAYIEDAEGVFFGNQLINHFGVLVNGLLVVDVDGRNGGFASAEKLKHIREQCEFIVKSGSGNGEHWYFRAENSGTLSQSVEGYEGIDFKSTGFIVGAYSLHKSGLRYEVIKGNPKTITAAPLELLTLLTKKVVAKTVTKKLPAFKIDDSDDLESILMHIDNHGHDYNKWLAVGMGIHSATNGGGDGLAMWENWTVSTGRSDTEGMHKKWSSFKSGGNQITRGTLVSWAKENGFKFKFTKEEVPVTFVSDIEWLDDEVADVAATATDTADNEVTFVSDVEWLDDDLIEVYEPVVECDVIDKNECNANFDILNPPGLVGELAQWINRRAIYPRKKLAVAAALQLVGNIAGLKHLTAHTKTSLNLITFGIAGSRTGKGAVLRCMTEVQTALGLAPATHGGFKSTQELVRNAIHQQPIHYIHDEFGKYLGKLANASKGGAHYLEDLMAQLIAMYSEATGTYSISGDLKREMAELADKAIAREIKKLNLDDDEDPWLIAQQDPTGPLYSAFMARKASEQGIINPFLTFFAVSEPGSFNEALEKDPWFLTGGFLGRALLFEELENVPMKKPMNEISDEKLPDSILNKLIQLSAGTDSSTTTQRIQKNGEFIAIPWTDEAMQFLNQMELYWRDVALNEQDLGSGLESQALGATELAIKVAGILSASDMMISKSNLQWAHELIKLITLDKIKRAKNSEKVGSENVTEKSDGLLESIKRHISNLESGQHTTPGKVRQAVGRTKVSLENVQSALDYLVSINSISVKEIKAKNGKTILHYF